MQPEFDACHEPGEFNDSMLRAPWLPAARST
jgi:hypothetical protein